MSVNAQESYLTSPGTYQRHIDGLRAVAVLSVIFYHFKVPGFSGGFVGVDIFFVISGYLITALILKEASQDGRFNFKRFYIRRMRRLFPAMAVTFAASLLVALPLLSPEGFQAFGRSLAAAVFSISNIFFWSESGYFDQMSHLKPLLHTWSLGVEEQFYLIWPALLWLTIRSASSRHLGYMLAVVGIASFVLNYIWVSGNFAANYQSTIFYLMPFRMFEFVIGAFAVLMAPGLMARYRLHEFGMLLGLALIAYAVITYDDNTLFPYYNALAPCIGALLVILCREAKAIGWVLNNRVSVGIGLISYSLYLVHWPLLVFYGYYRLEPLQPLEHCALLALTFFLSILMYYKVELPLRKNAPSMNHPAPQKTFVLTMTSVMLVLSLTGMYSYSVGGVTPFNKDAMSVSTITKGKNDRFNLTRKGCNLNRLRDTSYCDKSKPYQILVIGNSHEVDGYNAFTQVYPGDADVNLISFGALNTCHINFTAGVPVSPALYNRCKPRTELLNDEEFVSGLDGVVLSFNRPFAERNRIAWRILHHLRSINPNVPIVVMGGYINTLYSCTDLYHRLGSFKNCKSPRYASYNPFIEADLIATAGSPALGEYLFIDKTSLLCSGSTLETCQIEAAGEPAFYDNHHLSLPFARLLGRKIAESYREDLVSAGFPTPTVITKPK